ncbi:MAG TPA: pimeloyl-ACP methyl ester esterase BioH [Gammaproteobacteria bacterium]|nr:pimeloyl-ACP methyl ester esterase BioH [Gammaproteobacteria bacterium]
MAGGLYMETRGRGPELVLLHGWGLHGGVWDTLMPRLTARFRVTRVDLPGHGLSRGTAMSAELGAAAQQLLVAVPADAVWLGWSLGGLLALRAALDAPENMRALILANTTPRFITATDWPHAMPPEQLQEFALGLQQDYRETLLRFLSLQVRGDEAARASLRQLREALFARGEPDTVSLAAGLELLRRSDLRAELARISMPTLVIAGGYDRLTPPGAGEAMARAIPGARHALIAKSAHAPFISHAEEFIQALGGFMADAMQSGSSGRSDECA